jgi:hypothetical protein
LRSSKASSSAPKDRFLALAVTVVIGGASFCCLGYALTSLIRNEDAALLTTTAITLPLYFISGVFAAVTVLPHWLADVGEIFPVRHLANALLVAYNPHTTGLGFAGLDLLIVAAWGAAGLLIALRKFSWPPPPVVPHLHQRGRRRPRRRHPASAHPSRPAGAAMTLPRAFCKASAQTQ